MSITGQVGHVAYARQTAQGSPNNGALVPVKITGDSLVATSNPLIAEGEIGIGRDVTSAVPGGFQSAGAINGNLRARSASILFEACLGTKNGVTGGGGNTSGSYDTFTPANSQLSWWTVEKKVGSATPQQLVILYSDAMVNTLSISAPSGALATFSAGHIAATEARVDRTVGYFTTPLGLGPFENEQLAGAYPASSDDLLVFHGGRVFLGDAATGQPTSFAPIRDESWQSVEVAINNNIDATEYTVRPSRFLRSLTVGIRQIDINFTIAFDDPDKYSRFAYGQQSYNVPGYNLYMGAVQLFLGNYQLLNDAIDGVGSILPYSGAAVTKGFTPATPGTNVYNTLYGAGGATPAAPGNGGQFVQLNIPKAAFTGFPVALTSGRIVVTTSARALKDPNANIITAYVGPNNAGLNY